MTGSNRHWLKLTELGALLAAALSVAACTGIVSSSGAGTGAGQRPADAASGASADNGTTNAGASAGSGGAAPSNAVPATDPGRVTMHRLNLAEYDNTMRDLLGTQTHPSADFSFPVDDRGDDFDNTADVLSVSPLHFSCYETAATALISAALADPMARSLLVSCDLASTGTTCARSALETFTPRAWRRPVTGAELDQLMTLVTLATSQGDSAQVGLSLALKAVLLSPNCIYRPEIDPVPTSLTPHPLNDYELASRMSYFIWSSMPDEQLFAAAMAGNLHDPSTLASQVTRMLADPKAQAIVDNFAGQWLYTRLMDDVVPDPTLFPEFDTSLRDAFKAETQLMFREVAFNGLSTTALLTANFTFANDRLAKFYGLPPVGSTTPKRVDLTGNSQRQGLLSQGSFLTVNSHSDRTSPVRRGKYVLTELLCQDVPPPPPNVNVTIAADPTGSKTLRQVLEAHVQSPLCASCHKLMDPIGFGMEHYDAVGAYRTLDGTLPIDATGTMPNGQAVTGLSDITSYVANNPAFPACVATKLYTYALGRAAVMTDPAHMDASTLVSLSKQFSANGLKFQDLVRGVVMSPTFLNRRGEGS